MYPVLIAVFRIFVSALRKRIILRIQSCNLRFLDSPRSAYQYATGSGVHIYQVYAFIGQQELTPRDFTLFFTLAIGLLLFR